MDYLELKDDHPFLRQQQGLQIAIPWHLPHFNTALCRKEFENLVLATADDNSIDQSTRDNPNAVSTEHWIFYT
jgi:hypothetical protein